MKKSCDELLRLAKTHAVWLFQIVYLSYIPGFFTGGDLFRKLLIYLAEMGFYPEK